MLHILPSTQSSPVYSLQVRRPILQSQQFYFSYRFPSGAALTGTVVGDRYHNKPQVIFNLRSLSARYQHQDQVLQFDTGFGQFNVDFPGALFSGTDTTTGSFFSFSYRSDEATIYDAVSQQWLIFPWQPSAWSVHTCDVQPHDCRQRVAPERWHFPVWQAASA